MLLNNKVTENSDNDKNVLNTEGLLDLLDRILGKHYHTSGDNYSYKCPNNCHPTKHKLEINISTEQWACWICGSTNKFKGKKLITLFNKLSVPKPLVSELKLLLSDKTGENNFPIKSYKSSTLELPKEFQSLTNEFSNSNIIAKHALHYLTQRGITKEDIMRHNIGFCEYGEYSNMIIVPSYDKNGKLNFFTGRNFNKNTYKKYKNPTFSKDFIGFELFINWDTPIILVEGVFDALAVKRNVIPLFGKTIPNKLMEKIISSSVNKIYIALDEDARNQSLQHCKTLLSYNKEVYFVDVKDKDLSEMGFNKSLDLLENTYPLTFKSLLTQKLKL